MKKFMVAGGVALCILLAGCKEEKALDNSASGAPAQKESASAPQPAPVEESAWIGKWMGPEGTFLEITPEEMGYTITIQNLDGPRTFKGVSSGDGLSFERDGIQEFIRAGNGADTGMKWLMDKQHCLVIKTGEGYCRD